MLGGCGGGGSGTTTGSQRLQGTPDELRWALAVDRFAGGLLPDLRALERLTGGSTTTGAAGTRLDPRIFRPGRTRQQFRSAMTGLAACGTSLQATLPKAPSDRLRPVRRTLVHACTELERVPETLRDDVLAARSPAGVDRAVVKEARGPRERGRAQRRRQPHVAAAAARVTQR